MSLSNRSPRGIASDARQRAFERRIIALDRDKPITEDDLHARLRPRPRRFWGLGAVVLLILSYYLHAPLLVLCALLLLTIGAIPEIWYQIVLRGVHLRRDFAPRQVLFGEPATVIYQVDNHKFLPVPWLEVEDELSADLQMPGVGLYPSYKADRQLFITGMSLWANQRVTRRYQVLPLARGVWTFGPTYLRAGDPFGFLEHERKLGAFDSPSELMVLPLIVPLTRFGLPARNPFGELATQRRLIDDPQQVVGARDDQPGDSLRRIHWKATARSATLQSKVYPFTTTHTLSIFLDIHTTREISQGSDPDLFELGIAAAASVASWATKQRFAVGLFTNGLPLSSHAHEIDSFQAALRFTQLPPSTSPNQLVAVLRALARLQPLFGPPIERVLRREQYRLPLGATVIYIGATAALHPETLDVLLKLHRRGYSVALLLTNSHTDDASDTGPLRVYHLGGKETWHALIDHARQRYGSHRDDESGGSDDQARHADGSGEQPDLSDPSVAVADQHSFAVG